jgi:ubiquitin-protein ligase
VRLGVLCVPTYVDLTMPRHMAAHAMQCRSINLMRWKCFIPGKQGTDWDGGFFPLTMEFPEEYPAKPPKVTTACKIVI